MDLLVYDVEVERGPEDVPGGWNNPEAMGLASAVVYNYTTDQYHFFLHDTAKPRLLAMLYGNICVGFNSVRFDSRVLLGNDRIWKPKKGDYTRCRSVSGDHWWNYDIMMEYVRARFVLWDPEKLISWLDDPSNHGSGMFSLSSISRATLGKGKTGQGAHAPILYAGGWYDALLAYNLQDVRLTKELLDLILCDFPISGKDQIPITLPRKNTALRIEDQPWATGGVVRRPV